MHIVSTWQVGQQPQSATLLQLPERQGSRRFASPWVRTRGYILARCRRLLAAPFDARADSQRVNGVDSVGSADERCLLEYGCVHGGEILGLRPVRNGQDSVLSVCVRPFSTVLVPRGDGARLVEARCMPEVSCWQTPEADGCSMLLRQRKAGWSVLATAGGEKSCAAGRSLNSVASNSFNELAVHDNSKCSAAHPGQSTNCGAKTSDTRRYTNGNARHSHEASACAAHNNSNAQ